jgi:hypothetical protein
MPLEMTSCCNNLPAKRKGTPAPCPDLQGPLMQSGAILQNMHNSIRFIISKDTLQSKPSSHFSAHFSLSVLL